MKEKELKMIGTLYEADGEIKKENLDGLQMYKYFDRLIRKVEDKDVIIRALMEEICFMSHFLAHKDEEYLEFRNKIKNTPIHDDDFLDWTLNPPSIPEGTILEDKDWKPDEKEHW